MAWKVEFKKETLRFLARQNTDIQERIRKSLNLFLDYLEKGIFPFREMDIRRLKGKRKGFMRLRVGKMRIILRIDVESRVIKVYAIDYRGDVY